MTNEFAHTTEHDRMHGVISPDLDLTGAASERVLLDLEYALAEELYEKLDLNLLDALHDQTKEGAKRP